MRDFRLRHIVLVVCVIFLIGLIYTQHHLWKHVPRAKITAVSVDTSNTMQDSDLIAIDTITLTFKLKTKNILIPFYDEFVETINSNNPTKNFDNYGLHLDPNLEYPYIKEKDKDKIIKRITDKFLNKTHKEVIPKSIK